MMCPHCRVDYDDDNDTQPCCGSCGHPITCECSEDEGGVDFDVDED